MAETEVLEVEAQAEEGTQEAPSQPESLVGADLRMSPELLAQLQEAEKATPEPEATAEQDEEPPAEPEAPVDLMPQWVNDTLENPRAITKVPRSQQGAVIDAIKAQWINQANQYGQQMYLQGRQDAARDAEAEVRRAELESMQEDDPAGFVAWVKENPGEAAKFLQGKAVAPRAPSEAEILREAQAELAKLEAYPEAKAEIFAHPEKYPPTPAGLRALVRDVALAEARNQPASKQAAQRQQAAEKVSSAPKPDVSGSGAAAGPLTFEKLKTMSADDLKKYPKEEIDRVLMAGSRR